MGKPKAAEVSRAIVRAYKARGRELIPIHRSHGKRPLHKAWSTREYTYDQIQGYADRGFNIGYRLSAGDVVIDVDPRNGGLKGLKQLREDLGLEDLADEYATVITGSGGFHYYARLPDGVTKIRETIDRYPGVEFKQKGKQVVIAGSRHPKTGDLYRFDDLSPVAEPAAAIPKHITDRLAYDDYDPRGVDDEAERITSRELKELLSQLPVEEYADNDRWFGIMTAAHWATAGEGLGVFLNWSLGDPAYSDQGHIIKARWKSLKADKAGGRTLRSLYREVAQWTDGPSEVYATAAEDFGEADESVEAVAPKGKAKVVKVRAAAKTLDLESESKAIEKVLRKAARLAPLDREEILMMIVKRTGRPRGAIRGALNAAVKAVGRASGSTGNGDQGVDLEDLSQSLADMVLAEHYKGGRYLIHGRDQSFWAFTGTHWTLQAPNMIKRAILSTTNKLRKLDDVHFDTANIIGKCETILEAKTATDRDLLRFEDIPPSVINTKNFELWIDPTTGLVRPVKHRARSYLTACLDVAYDSAATCPRFDRALMEIFDNAPDAEDVIAHLWEIIGYVLQPRKDIASWFLFIGAGANGKTFIIKVLSALLGSAVIERSVGEFDTGRNVHAFADLPGKLALIDEDLKPKTVLPEDFLKKVSENKSLTADPKYRAAYRFKCAASVIMAANHWPRTRDLSRGMRRRAYVVPFDRAFTPAEMDRNLDTFIIENELAGVLNRALEGIKRLRSRGDFSTPLSCSLAKQTWIEESSQAQQFLNVCTKPIPRAKTTLSDLFVFYRNWAADEGIERHYSKPGFRKALLDLGYNVVAGSKNKRFVEGSKLLNEVYYAEEFGD